MSRARPIRAEVTTHLESEVLVPPHPTPRPPEKSPQRFLGALDAIAELRFDHTTEGWILSIGDAEQSHVDPQRPGRVFYEYLRRIANVIDCAAAQGEPIRAVHLGAGAMTLPRYIAATRPHSPQCVLELARELPDFVLSHLPWPDGADVEVLTGDAREHLETVAATTAVPADVIVLDIFAGAGAPAHLRERSFYRELRALLAPSGLLVVNVGDDAGLAFFAEQARTMLLPERPGMSPVFEDVWCLTEHSMLSASRPGNLILVAATRALPPEWAPELRAAGPHPGAVLERWDLENWLETL